MAFADTTWYANAGDQSTTGHYAVAKFAASTTYTAGQLVRQLTAPAVGGERVFVVVVAGTSASSEPTWVLTRGSKTTSGTVTFQECTGQAAFNGDVNNTTASSSVRSFAIILGQVIRNNSATHYFMATGGNFTSGASEPTFNTTTGASTTDGTGGWTCMGPITNFTGGQAPHARLANACATNWFAAGNTVYVGDNHAESVSSGFLNVLGASTTALARVLCHNHAGPYPPTATDLMSGASISSSVGGGAYGINGTGWWYVYGLTFKAGVGYSSGGTTLAIGVNSCWYAFDNCSFQLNDTGANASIPIAAASGCVVTFNNSTVRFANSSGRIGLGSGAKFIWQNTGPVLVAGSTVPTTLILANASSGVISAVLEALDLSQITSALVSANATTWIADVLIKDCKLNASVSINGAAPAGPGFTLQSVRSDSAATAYKSARYQYEGAETTETSITRVGGASDPAGQAQSRKIVTTANVQWLRPFKAEPYAIWNPTTGSNVTVTVCGTINAGALPNNDDIWLEVEYLGSATSPLGTILSTTKSNLLAANAAVASDGSSWNVSSFTTFDPTTTALVSLSGGGLVVTSVGSNQNEMGAQCGAVQNSGKFYFEMVYTTLNGTPSNLSWGVGPPLQTYTNMGPAIGGGLGGAILSRGGSSVFTNGVNQGSIAGGTAMSQGDRVSCAVDLTNRQVWFRRNAQSWNGSGTADPATNVGGFPLVAGPMVPFVTMGGSSGVAGAVTTANFGATSFVGAVPSGFTSGWPSNWTPFKLTTTLSAPQPGLAGYLHARVRVAKPSMTVYVDPSVQLS